MQGEVVLARAGTWWGKAFGLVSTPAGAFLFAVGKDEGSTMTREELRRFLVLRSGESAAVAEFEGKPERPAHDES